MSRTRSDRSEPTKAQGLRIGGVSFLNSRILLAGLDEYGTTHTLRLAPPSQLARWLAAGEIDVGLIPVVEYFRTPGLAMLDLGIVADGAVDSVKLFSSVPASAVQRIALDLSSRSSAALLKVLMAEHFRVRPEYFTLHPEQPRPDDGVDAFLLIGDPCLRFDPSPETRQYDLAALWKDLTGLPFVFAAWCGRPPQLARAEPLLRNACARGLEQSMAVAQAHAPAAELDAARAHRYITRQISYGITPEAEAGLRRFRCLAARHGLVPQGVGLDLWRG